MVHCDVVSLAPVTVGDYLSVGEKVHAMALNMCRTKKYLEGWWICHIPNGFYLVGQGTTPPLAYQDFKERLDKWYYAYPEDSDLLRFWHKAWHALDKIQGPELVHIDKYIQV